MKTGRKRRMNMGMRIRLPVVKNSRQKLTLSCDDDDLGFRKSRAFASEQACAPQHGGAWLLKRIV